jgi:hypothetical protein
MTAGYIGNPLARQLTEAPIANNTTNFGKIWIEMGENSAKIDLQRFSFRRATLMTDDIDKTGFSLLKLVPMMNTRKI